MLSHKKLQALILDLSGLKEKKKSRIPPMRIQTKLVRSSLAVWSLCRLPMARPEIYLPLPMSSPPRYPLRDSHAHSSTETHPKSAKWSANVRTT
jgi:hypothetical protein